MPKYSRREWLAHSGAAALAAGVPLRWRSGPDDLDEFIENLMRTERVPGLSAAVVRGRSVVWSKGYGWANIKDRIRIDPDRTVQNIGSISKTVTATAVMQLVERGAIKLDADVNQYLPFRVRSPHHPDLPITCRQLLTHRSSIADGPAYGASYACGDPTVDLRSWVEGYLTPAGRYYDPKTNFQPWKPGEQGPLVGAIGRNYTNVGFGLLGLLAGEVAGVPFSRYCRDHIFAPLGMNRTGWFLSEIDQANHAVPYRAEPKSESEVASEVASGLLGTTAERESAGATGYLPYCRYGFPNYPDGAVRTSVTQLARFLIAHSQPGGEGRILAPETIAAMLSPQVASDPRQGLCWVTGTKGGARYWGHNGADPGVVTTMSFWPSTGVGIIVFATSLTGAVEKVSARLFEEAGRF